jgi:ribosomal protein S14
MRLAYLTVSAALHCSRALSADGVEVRRCDEFVAMPAPAPDSIADQPPIPEKSLMTKLENRCANCGGKLGLVCHYHWGLRFCRKACKHNFLAETAKHHACMRKWLRF